MQPSMDKSRESSNTSPKQNHMPYPPTQNDSVSSLKQQACSPPLNDKNVAKTQKRHSHKHVALNQMT